MDIKEKMKLMYDNPVVGWHEHVCFTDQNGGDYRLNAAMMERQLASYEKLGIDKSVISRPVTEPKRCSTEMFKAANKAVYDAMKAYPNIYYGMAYVHAGYLKEALYEIDHCIQDLGMVGIKIYYDYFLDDPLQYPIIEKCIELDIPLMIHSMRCMDPPNIRRQYTTSDGVRVANAAKRYPECTFQLGHFTITDWQYQLKAMAPYKNIYTDMSGSAYDAPQMEQAVRMLGADRILFATDESHVACVGKILGAKISEEEKKTILAGKAFARYLERGKK